MTKNCREKEVGSGITRRKVPVYETVQDALAAALKSIPLHAFEELYAGPLEQWSRYLLMRAGYDPGPELQNIPEIEPPDSPRGYAARSLALIRVIRRSIREDKPGYHEITAHFAFELGMLTMEANMKFLWEPLALSGQKTHKTLKALRESRSENLNQEKNLWREEALKLWRAAPCKKQTEIARIIVQRFKLNKKRYHSVRRYIAHLDPRKS